MSNTNHNLPEGGSALVEALMQAAFHPARDPRSDAYKRGVRELLNKKALGTVPQCPYLVGTAEADAYFSGWDEGNLIWRKHLEAVGAADPNKSGVR